MPWWPVTDDVNVKMKCQRPYTPTLPSSYMMSAGHPLLPNPCNWAQLQFNVAFWRIKVLFRASNTHEWWMWCELVAVMDRILITNKKDSIVDEIAPTILWNLNHCWPLLRFGADDRSSCLEWLLEATFSSTIAKKLIWDWQRRAWQRRI